MSILDKDLKRTLEFLDNHEARLRRLETQEIGVPLSGGISCLEVIELTSDESSVTFSAIDQWFWHLWLWIAAHQVDFGIPVRMYIRFNADSGNTYQWSSIFHIRFETGGTADTSSHTTDFPTGISIGHAGSNDNFGYCEANIYNYLNTGNGSFQRGSTWKSWVLAPSIEEAPAFFEIGQGGGDWINTTDPITSLAVHIGSGSFQAGSVFTLLGICSIA